MSSYPTTGLWMLLALALLITTTGLPVWALLIGNASLFAAIGCVLGVIDLQVLSAVGARTLGLLENDLLQALPLYVFVGVLLQRLRVADAVFSSLAWLTRRSGAGTSIAAFGVGALVAPMNGSVASSSALLARLVAPRLGQLQSARAIALISAASTIGVVVPPSLVLILLGDAMLRAHTEASNLNGYAQGGQRIVNTQDVFHAALLPALTLLLLWLLVAWWQGRKAQTQAPDQRVTPRQWLQALAIVAATLLLLGGVFTGKVLAVEAAASGALALVGASLFGRTLSWSAWRAVCADSLALSGALLGLLVGATTFSLVFRLWGTDQWLTATLLASPLPALPTAALVLLAVALCAWVLDAFEMIFVILPVVAPPLILQLGDAQQAAVLLLLVLQLSFLLPPMGYAVLMARAGAGLAAPALRATLAALWPYLAAQCVVTAWVFLAPWSVHQLDATAPVAASSETLSDDQLLEQMREMAAPPLESNPPR
ncbi:MAG: TRAP transporter large permease subunit [Rhodoferax sp.]